MVVLRIVVIVIREGIEAHGLGGVVSGVGSGVGLSVLVLFGREVIELILGEAVRHYWPSFFSPGWSLAVELGCDSSAGGVSLRYFGSGSTGCSM